MPSSVILENKKAQVQALTEAFKAADTIVLADYRGITVEQDTALRAELRKAGVKYHIVKNSLASRAANELGYTELEEVFKGPTAIALSTEDPIAPARILKDFEKKCEAFTVKGGVMEGRVASLEEITALSKVPGREVLLSKLVGSLISPIAGLAMIVDAIAKKAEENGATLASEVVVSKEAQETAEVTAE